MDRAASDRVKPVATLLVAPSELGAGRIRIRGGDYHHLFRARRLAVGDRLRLVDGAGGACWALVRGVDRSGADVEPGPPAPANESVVEVVLLAAPPRPKRLTWMVEKATEVGVAAICLLRCERTPRAPGHDSLERLRRVARAAMEQSHRSRLPRISGPHALDELAQLLEPIPERWLLDAGTPGSAPVAVAAATAVLVGPEGGWSDGERRRLEEIGCRPVSLGASVLRTETAAVVGVSLAAGAAAGDKPRHLR